MFLSKFYQRYSDAWLKAVNKAYFNQHPETYEPLKKYLIGNREFLFTYRHKKLGYSFGVFVPADIQLFDTGIDYHGATLSEEASFIGENHEEFRKDNIKFLLIPCGGTYQLKKAKNGDKEAVRHWTALKISLTGQRSYQADYYDPSFRKRPAIAEHIHQILAANLSRVNLRFKHKLTTWVQLDDLNCGAFTHDIMKDLANEKTPDILLKTGVVERTKDYNHLNKAQKSDENKEYGKQEYTELNQQRIPVPPKLLTFLVKHRRKILAAALILTFSLSVALLIISPPAGIAGLVAMVAASSSLSIPVLATLSALALTALNSTIGLIVFGVKKMIKNSHKPAKTNEIKEFEVINLPSKRNPLSKIAKPSNEKDVNVENDAANDFTIIESSKQSSEIATVSPENSKDVKASADDFEITSSSDYSIK